MTLMLRLQINYINAHATSTLVGDIAEVKAIKQVFPDPESIKINGTKSMIGHCLGAAAGIEGIATIQAIRTGWLHPTLNQVRCSRPQQLLSALPGTGQHDTQCYLPDDSMNPVLSLVLPWRNSQAQSAGCILHQTARQKCLSALLQC